MRSTSVPEYLFLLSGRKIIQWGEDSCAGFNRPLTKTAETLFCGDTEQLAELKNVACIRHRSTQFSTSNGLS